MSADERILRADERRLADHMTDPAFIYEKEDHAAAWTSDYVFHQLIPYIGNKRKLLGLIQLAIAKTITRPPGIFFDVFAGSGVVARMAKKMGYQVIANDWEPYALEINRCAIECNQMPAFNATGGYEATIHTLNTLPPIIDWITRHLCPSSDENHDTERDRLFYTRSNGMIIDAIRTQILEWEQSGAINQLEKACLLAPMLYQACYTSNTSGVFKGFHNGWGGQTKTALYRILSTFQLKPAVFYDNGLNNSVYQMEGTNLARLIAQSGAFVDIAYLDPPYNQHPYGSNYHVLNSIALWDKPHLSEKIEKRNKAAIRADWRTQRRSAYNYKDEAEQAYANLIAVLHAHYILTSYSTDGIIPLRNMVAICVQKGFTDFVQRAYKRYRVSSQRFSEKPLTVEFILIVDTTRKHSGASVDTICEHILNAEVSALNNHSAGRFD